MSIVEYLNQFRTREEVKKELARLQRNIENINFNKYNYWKILGDKKRALVDKFNNEFCIRKEYMDDCGRLYAYYEEVV